MQNAEHSRRAFLQLASGVCATAALPSLADADLLASPPTDLPSMSLREASELVRTKKVSPKELTAACLARIERLNPTLNAFITVTAEQAMTSAQLAEAEIMKGRWRGPLHGIPVGLKDLFDTQGVKTTAASAFFADRVPTTDAEVVRRLNAVGAVILGKQNMHEFAFGASSVASHFGAVHNPWNRDYVAGGSSGGSAAAVAACLCYGAIGSDTGGSIRQPASLCGVVGLKPSYGRVSTRGVIPLSWSLDHVGPLTRTVLDSAVLLQAIAGYDAQEATSLDRPVPVFTAGLTRGAASLRVGVPREYFFAALHPDVQGAVERALAALAKLTAGLQEVSIPVSPNVNTTVMPAEAFAFHATRVREAPEKFQPEVLQRLRQGESIDTPTYIERRRELDQLRRAAGGLFGKVDLLVTPTMPLLPVQIAEVRDDEAAVALYSRNTRPFNTYGLPAVSVPCGFSRDGFPIGLQIVGPSWGEESVLRLAHAFERTADSRARRPLP
jgi:aspartyl-tRNA(Asn)/glutamyl-tRNA(Gln) amidotransferase subunit A